MSKPRKPGRPTKTDRDTATEILTAGMRRFAAQGYDATSMRQIAGDAGVDVSLISYQFGSKLALWQAIVSGQSQELLAHLDAARIPDAQSDRGLALRRAMQGFIDFLIARPLVPRFLLRDLSTDDERTNWLLQSLTIPLHENFVALAEAAAHEGAIDRDHCAFRMANFVYAASSTVARRERLAQMVTGVADDSQFRASLNAVLIEPVFHHG